MRVVQVSVSRAAFADTLGAMRDWLDRNNRPLVRFETQTEGETTSPCSLTTMPWPTLSGRLRSDLRSRAEQPLDLVQQLVGANRLEQEVVIA
jgi:hypothetical protein